MKHPQLPEILNSLRQYLDGLYGEHLVRLILFGSQARDEAQPNSDIDVLVVLKGEVDAWTEIKRTGEGIAKLCLDHTIVICCLFISEIHFQEKQTALLRNVSQEGISL
jgi:uncharacterized protein